ncbi:OadG family protein [Pseudoalteromonas sp. SSDWG2]|uniref:OadG family protein n=1 Tax=Pseudoalteromonas sp. SSDWG2 TaxID=3139391 RepID=UPI003BAC2FB7
MNIAELMLEAAGLMATGMLVVFVFLMILIGVLKLMSHFLAETDAPISPAPSRASTGVPKAHIAAIAAAVHQYKKQ